jgi:multiple sugar transport system ATP-binding protein
VVIHGRAGQDTLVFKQDPHRPAVVGSVIEVQLELDSLHLFDAESELRLGA